MPLFKAIGPLYLSFIGQYGKTYAVNYSLYSGLLGGLIVFIAPSLSKKITESRKGKALAFQGVVLTLSLLIIVGILIQFSLTNLGSGTVTGPIEKGQSNFYLQTSLKKLFKMKVFFY